MDQTCFFKQKRFKQEILISFIEPCFGRPARIIPNSLSRFYANPVLSLVSKGSLRAFHSFLIHRVKKEQTIRSFSSSTKEEELDELPEELEKEFIWDLSAAIIHSNEEKIKEMLKRVVVASKEKGPGYQRWAAAVVRTLKNYHLSCEDYIKAMTQQCAILEKTKDILDKITDWSTSEMTRLKIARIPAHNPHRMKILRLMTVCKETSEAFREWIYYGRAEIQQFQKEEQIDFELAQQVLYSPDWVYSTQEKIDEITYLENRVFELKAEARSTYENYPWFEEEKVFFDECCAIFLKDKNKEMENFTMLMERLKVQTKQQKASVATMYTTAINSKLFLLDEKIPHFLSVDFVLEAGGNHEKAVFLKRTKAVRLTLSKQRMKRLDFKNTVSLKLREWRLKWSSLKKKIRRLFGK